MIELIVIVYLIDCILSIKLILIYYKLINHIKKKIINLHSEIKCQNLRIEMCVDGAVQFLQC